MLRVFCFLLVCSVLGVEHAPADIIQLKDKAAITGKILAEKRDQVAVDIGYTVLVIPRNQIDKISRSESQASTSGLKAAKTASEPDFAVSRARVGFYSVSARSMPAQTVRTLVDQLGESVVQVRTPSGLGSGFLVNEDGYLITNFHVVEGETRISVEVYQNRAGQIETRTYKQVRIIAMNKFVDLALLKIEDKDAPKFKSVLLGSADALAVGDRVFAIGSPLGLERTVTEGILSTKTRQMQGELYLQTTAQINPGNSGGPLFDMTGQVIGVTNMKINFGEGLGFAIPVEAVRYFLDHREAYAYSNENPSTGFRYLEPPSRTRHTAPEE